MNNQKIVNDQKSAKDWAFPDNLDRSPHKELAKNVFYYAGFFFFLCVLWALAFTVWAAFQHFYPSTACMVQSLFSAVCK